MLNRRTFLKSSLVGGAGGFLLKGNLVFAQAPGGTLDPLLIPKYLMPLVIPPAMPRTSKLNRRGLKNIDYYEIAMRQFAQQILPPSMPATTVWSYGSVNHPGSFNYPSFTIEAKCDSPVRVKWINDLKDPVTGNYLPHLLPVDQTLHWANPPGGITGRDSMGTDGSPYAGPVPMVTHVHGAHVSEESDGYPEAWYLPDAANIPSGYARAGSWYAKYKSLFETAQGSAWDPGTAIFQYPNDQNAATLWYHDHSLGMTRLNVYAGPAGFYLLRGGPADAVVGTLPGPAPALGDPAGMDYYEIPIAIQDRSFNDDGSLFFPSNRAFFEGLEVSQLRFPFAPDSACDGPSDIAPIWNPEFFGNCMVVNGRAWPYLKVEQRRYRLRLLNGCNARFLILRFDNSMPMWQIGAEGGFLPAPVMQNDLLMAPAERADVIVDFSRIPAGTTITLLNLGPDEPYGGGLPGIDFEPSDPQTTGQILQFRVVSSRGVDRSTRPDRLLLPKLAGLGPSDHTRQVSLNELDSETVRVITDASGNIKLACDDPSAEPFGPAAALLGTLDGGGDGVPRKWMDAVTEDPALGSTETWEVHNFTMDAHPIHVHQVAFQVVDRYNKTTGVTRGPEPGETGYKETVIAYPDEITRVKMKFDLPGRYVWHCHIVDHEDNEMMRPFHVG